MKADRGQIERAFRNPPAGIRLYLLYGPDEGESLALARQLDRAMGADAERVDLDGATLKADPARLADEAAAISLFGGKRHIRATVTGEDALPAVEALLAAPAAGNPVVLIAGALRATSALLKRVLADPAAMVCVSYALDARKAVPVAIEMGQAQGVKLGAETARAIALAAGHDRALIAAEIEKLALYLDAAPDRPAEAGTAAIAAIGAGEGDAETSRLVDALLSGQPGQAGRELAALSDQGISGIPLVRALARRVQLLMRLAGPVAAGSSPNAVVAAEGKAIFFGDREAVIDQLGRWTPARLARLAIRLLAIEREIKAANSPGDIIADVDFLRIARTARQAR